MPTASPEVIKITYYDIKRCGYIENATDNLAFGNTLDTMEDLYQWIQRAGISIRDTKTFDIDRDDTHQHTYLHSMNKFGQDFLVITWNETESTDGQIFSIDGTAPIGSPQIDLSDIPENNIPGFATYFWIIPDRNVIFTLQFKGRNNGHRNFKRYINNFMRKFSKHKNIVTRTKPDGSTVIVNRGYKEQPTSAPISAKPTFESEIKRVSGNIPYIQTNCAHIKKIIQKDLLKCQVAIQPTLIEQLFAFLGIASHQELTEDLHFQYQLDYKPTRGELDSIIANWRTQRDDAWDDVGFLFDNNPTQTPLWLSKELLKEEITVPIERLNKEIVVIDHLHRNLAEQKEHIFSLFAHSNLRELI